MKLKSLAALAVSIAAPLSAQEDEGFARLALRVTSAGASTVVVDRGSRDAVRAGDRVVFHPREGGTFEGSVRAVEERSAEVELQVRSFLPAPGTRGEVLIPKSRLAPAEPPPSVAPQPRVSPQEPPPQEQPRPRSTWRNPDNEYQTGEPLLAHTKPVHPEERPLRVTGLVYTIGQLTQTPPDDSFSNSLFRVGTDVYVENPFGEGGALRFDGEINYKTEVNDQAGFDLLVRRLAYEIGGTRFTKNRLQLGRFLQYGMPEFGILDGVEYTRRMSGGHQLGATFGFLPTLDDDVETGNDLQLAAYWLWSVDELERLQIGAGVQATLHHGDFDRLLMVGKIRYLPLDAWRVAATVWADVYEGADDPAKGGGVEVTQVRASVGRTWSDSGVDLGYWFQRFPELLRNGEFIPVNANQLADDYYHRLTLTGWTRWTETTELHGLLAGWKDEEDSGGSAELGLLVDDLIGSDTQTDLMLFATRGNFTSAAGPRLLWGKTTPNGRWDLLYELGFYHQLDRANDADDFLQHRLRASRSLYWETGWDLNAFAEAALFDSDFSWSLGINVQKRF